MTPILSLNPQSVVQEYTPPAKHSTCQCIVPDHIFKHLAENHPKKSVREHAVKHLKHAKRVRKHQGSLFHKITKVEDTHQGKIEIFNGNHDKKESHLPGALWDRQRHWDDAAKEAFNGLQDTYAYYKDVRDRLSIDGKNMDMEATVHWREGFDNAYWNGSQMVFGDGDGKIFNRFTIDLDVTAHELSHGVTQYFAGTATGEATGIAYESEAGGLNEGFSDIAGIQVKQWKNKSTVDDPNAWLIGEHLLVVKPGDPPQALRNMLYPGTAYDNKIIGKDPQVASMSEMKQYLEANKNKIDPHLSSGIHNRAFAIAATELGGYSWEKAGAVMYATLPHLTYNATFADCCKFNIQIAEDMFKEDPKVADAYRKAWTTVEVYGYNPVSK